MVFYILKSPVVLVIDSVAASFVFALLTSNIGRGDAPYVAVI